MQIEDDGEKKETKILRDFFFTERKQLYQFVCLFCQNRNIFAM